MGRNGKRPLLMRRGRKRHPDIRLWDTNDDDELVHAFKHGSPVVSERAMGALCEKHGGMMGQLARRYANQGVPLEDLMQCARIGLLKAVRRLDSRRASLTTYAPYWILSEIQSAIVDESHAHPGFRVPANEFRRTHYVHRAQARLSCKGLDYQDPRFILSDIKRGDSNLIKEMTIEHVERCLAITGTVRRLDAPVRQDDEGATFLRLLPDPHAVTPESEHAVCEEFHKAMERIRTMTPRWQEAIYLRFGITNRRPLTLEECGRRMSVTRERIRQIEAKALARLGLTGREFANLLEAFNTVMDSAA